MKSLHTIQALSRLGKVLSSIAFVCSVVGFCICTAGLMSLHFGGSILKIGGVTIHGLIAQSIGVQSAAVLFGWLIVCAGEGVLARFAETYFKHMLSAETPFTLSGAKELRRLGILTIVIPTCCSMAGSIAAAIAADLMQAEQAAVDFHFGGEASVVLGIMFLLGALLCRYGAELREVPIRKLPTDRG